MNEKGLDSRVRNTFYLLFGTIVYIVAMYAILQRLDNTIKDISVLFALTLLPLLAIFVMVWGYGLKFRMPGMELEYYPVEKVMKALSTISGNITGMEAEKIMDKEKTDFLNILDKDGLFQGIFTNADANKAHIMRKTKNKVKNLMTGREKVIHAFEREDLKSIMEKIGQTKHSRLPVLDKNNRLMGIVDSVDINYLLSKVLR